MSHFVTKKTLLKSHHSSFLYANYISCIHFDNVWHLLNQTYPVSLNFHFLEPVLKYSISCFDVRDVREVADQLLSGNSLY